MSSANDSEERGGVWAFCFSLLNQGLGGWSVTTLSVYPPQDYILFTVVHIRFKLDFKVCRLVFLSASFMAYIKKEEYLGF